jgi:ATPase subunit of ABC transporter with duplicated ATPase domains
MPSLRLHHVGATVAGRCLFHDVTLHAGPGWTGLVGPNGAGKSTLLSLLAGVRPCDEGHVERQPPDASVVLVPQRTTRTAEVLAFADADDALARRWQARLGLHGLDRWDSLSFGERKRWQVGAALWREPAVLLLDEPTNHLDADATKVLLAALARYDGVGVLVSHDRAALDALTVRSWRLARGVVEAWDGGFSKAREAWRAKEAAARQAHEDLGRTVERLERSLAGSRREHEAATKQRSAGARMKSRHDSDARGLSADYRAARAEGRLSGNVRRLEGQSERLRSARDALPVSFDDAVTLTLPGERCPSPVVARLPAGPVRAQEVTLFEWPTVLEVPRDARLAIVGPNGAGKTTLLEALRRGATVPAERVLVMPQDLTPDDAAHDLEALAALPRLARGRVLQWVHALGVDPDALLTSRAPSAGEARLLHLALGLETSPWLLLLDEPTNHLSFDLIERLEQALVTLPCAVVLVSHDARLVQTVATTVLRLPP